jgi:hypothetical protein
MSALVRILLLKEVEGPNKYPRTHESEAANDLHCTD